MSALTLRKYSVGFRWFTTASRLSFSGLLPPRWTVFPQNIVDNTASFCATETETGVNLHVISKDGIELISKRRGQVERGVCFPCTSPEVLLEIPRNKWYTIDNDRLPPSVILPFAAGKSIWCAQPSDARSTAYGNVVSVKKLHGFLGSNTNNIPRRYTVADNVSDFAVLADDAVILSRLGEGGDPSIVSVTIPSEQKESRFCFLE